MIEITEGSELDTAVAEAIGLMFTHKVIGSSVKCWADPRSGLRRTFNPSTILQDAFYAADISFSDYAVHKLGEGRYEFECFVEGDDGRSRCGEHDSVCLAICAAILMRKALLR